MPEAAKERKARRKRAEQEAQARRRRKKDKGYDLWETVKREGASGYRIPELNRRDDEVGAQTWRSRLARKEESSDDED